ncbi:RraA-like protein [Choiromyces venosus 120613-1]|uniref:RraA-like protein n=1 Tax=Choiromyces venosus 120613-1 TaxID=1336337 RepID=A0A3N4JW53_9PEZI|nr:RraA-like protein [Choiromyces venosus 120613-1]
MRANDITPSVATGNTFVVSDALVKLGYSHGGFLCDITPRTSLPERPIIAPATTVQFATKSNTTFQPSPTSTAPLPGAHFADLIAPGHAVVITQEKYTSNALVGGIVAARMRHLDAPVVVVDGRVRDVPELKLPVYARGTSTVGAGAGSKVVGVGGKVVVGGEVEAEEGVRVCQGDWVFGDRQGVVVFPKGLLEKVVGLVRGVVEADQRVLEDVLSGSELAEAFREHRR